MKSTIIQIILGALCLLASEPDYFDYTKTSDNLIIKLDSSISLKIGDGFLSYGDEIGVFNQDDICVGGVVWKEEATFIAAYAETDIPSDNGLKDGEYMKFKVWDASENILFDSIYVTFKDFLNNPHNNEFDIYEPYLTLDSFYAYRIYTPDLVNPKNNLSEISDTPDFEWKPISSATSYGFELSGDSLFSILIINKNYSNSLTSNHYTPLSSELEKGVKYFWRVRAHELNDSSNWSAPWSFITQLAPPVLDLPADASLNQEYNPQFKWNDVDNANLYEFRITNDETLTTFLHTETSVAVSSYELYAINLTPFTEYFWQVRAKNDISTSEWSEVWSFTTKLTTPTLALPADDAINQILNPDFTWTIVSGASEYDFRISTDETFTTTDYTETISTNSLSLSSYDLSYNTEYFWQVKATDGVHESDWSAAFSLITKLKAPQLYLPADASIDVILNPTFAWEYVSGAYDYMLEISTTDDFDNAVFSQNSIIDDYFNLPEDQIEGSTKYFWRVKARNDLKESNWSDYFTFTTEDVELLIDLVEGWNLISSNIMPDESDMTNVFADIDESFEIVKDDSGNILIPQFGINTICNWNTHDGYSIFSNSDATLSIIGSKVKPEEETINLRAGYNYLPYLRDTSMDIETALQSIEADIVIVKDINGNLYIPAFGINTIGNLVTGKAYLIYLVNTVDLTYPEND